MKDHEIENIVKIDKIDSADNDKSCRYQYLSIDWYNQYQSKSDYRQLSIYRLVFQHQFLSIAPLGIIRDWHSFKGLTDTQQHTVTQSMV